MTSDLPVARRVTTHAEAAQLRRGDHVTVEGYARNGQRVTVTGFVVIVCRVAFSNAERPGPDAPLSVTLNTRDAYTGDPADESSVILYADPRFRFVSDDVARHGTQDSCERCEGGTVCSHVAQTLTLSIEVDVRRESGPAAELVDILAALRVAIEEDTGSITTQDGATVYSLTHVDYRLPRSGEVTPATRFDKAAPAVERDPSVLTIGDTSRDGLLEITDTRWDHNGTMFVTVREKMGTGCWRDGLPIERMRRLARRALAHPERTRSSRVVRQWSAQGCDHVTFAVSRLDPEQ